MPEVEDLPMQYALDTSVPMQLTGNWNYERVTTHGTGVGDSPQTQPSARAYTISDGYYASIDQYASFNTPIIGVKELFDITNDCSGMILGPVLTVSTEALKFVLNKLAKDQQKFRGLLKKHDGYTESRDEK